MPTRICNVCGEEKDLEEDFYKNSLSLEGYLRRCKSCQGDVQKNYRTTLKNKVYDYYGWLCSCCGETEPLFLTIDHKNNDGAKHRKTFSKTPSGGMTDQLYKHIIDNGYPDEFQILCFNCNTGKERNNGICPHKINILEL